MDKQTGEENDSVKALTLPTGMLIELIGTYIQA